MKNKPNILFIMSDEHDAGVTGCYGDPLVETPNLDRLAETGVLFENHYCNSPLCVPSRLSFTAGKLTNKIDVWNNTNMLPSADYPSLPRELRKVGYRPVLCGKQHYEKSRRYGFDDLLPHLNDNTKKPCAHRRAADNTKENIGGWEQRSAQFYTSENGGILDHDREVCDTTIQFLKDAKSSDEPWFLFSGFLAPHFPLIVPDEFYQKYKGKVPLPEIPEGLLASQPLNYQHLRMGFGVSNPDPKMVQYGRDLYWALTDWFDSEVGRILDVLKDSEVADNTIVIYTSDHGENKGDHGLWWKNNMYDHSAKVPLIVSYPAEWKGGVRRSEVTSHVDLVQTLVAIAGGSAPDDWDGEDMSGLISDQSASWHNTAVSQYHGHNICSSMTMFREGDFKYIYHAAREGECESAVELYNMVDDPKEFKNLAEEPFYKDVLKDLHAKMVAQLGEEPDDIESRCLMLEDAAMAASV